MEVFIEMCCGEIPIAHADGGFLVALECPICGRTVYVSTDRAPAKTSTENVAIWNKGVKKRGR